MKKLMILAATAAMVLAGCVKTNVTTTISNDDQLVPIGFANYAPRATKAGDTYVAGAELVKGNDFAVYAWAHEYNSKFDDQSGAPGFMNPAIVTWNEDKESGVGNTYSPVRYWPVGATPDAISFFSYYPVNTAIVPAVTKDGNQLATFKFTVDGDAAKMVDFLVADAVAEQYYEKTNVSPDYPATVQFTFHHMLTKVAFQFQAATETLEGVESITSTISEVKLNGINSVATLTANTASADNSWTEPETALAYDLDYAEKTLSALVKPGDEDLFLFIPQTLDAQNLTVKWSTVIKYTDGVETTNTKEATIALKDILDGDGNAITWGINKSIVYTITVGSGIDPTKHKILFTGKVVEWEDDVEGAYSIE